MDSLPNCKWEGEENKQSSEGLKMNMFGDTESPNWCERIRVLWR
jgi:hypothetical protein